ncbi:Leguminosin secreted peptide [Quillaja saponaria]|uniref:Leguminosin secreted peptide n=1 Tax=Quillaja saponaria TaxID=32244 RepID=A0AAD7PV02_QUISA|nr:Leguminosin secreted peptide [Quillaja saponaria]
MASTHFLVLLFFFALYISSIDTVQASRKLMQGGCFPGLTFPPLPPRPSLLTGRYPEFKVPPPITTRQDFPSLPFFSPPAIPTPP